MIGFAALLLATAQTSAPYYICNEVFPNFDGALSSLALTKSFQPDRPTLRIDAEAPSVVRPQPGARPWVRLRWPVSPTFDPATGTIEIDSDGSGSRYAVPSAYAARPDDLARRVVVDRRNALHPVLQADSGGVWELFLSPFGQFLTSLLIQPSQSPILYMSIDSLLAWGAGLPSLTVYQTMISSDATRRRGHWLYGAERVTGSYEIDMPALTRLLAKIRIATERWERRLSRDRSHCRLEQPLDVIFN